MKKYKLNSLTSIVITMAIMLSCGGYLIADDAEQPEVVDEPVIEQVEEEQPVETDENVEQPEIVEPEVVEADDALNDNVDPDSGESSYEEVIVEVPINVDVDFDNDEMAEQYIMNEMAIGPQVCYSRYNYDYELSELDAYVYSNLRSTISSIAAGTQLNTEFAIPDPDNRLSFFYTESDLGLSGGYTDEQLEDAIADHLPMNTDAIIDTLLSSCPYELYWYDKTQGSNMKYSLRIRTYSDGTKDYTVTNFTYIFRVSQDYQGENNLTVDSKYGTAVSNAVANANAIISRYSNRDDYGKLLAYNDEICLLVDYNHEAARDEYDHYGDPWQLVWVFDGDPETDVVCEGYSKAFQFLCDNTVFSSDKIYAISVTGELDGGNHMWNIVHMDDDLNYLVDVTNSDHDGLDVAGRGLFLVGTEHSASGSYYFSYRETIGNRIYSWSGTFTYADDLIYTDNELSLSTSNYQRSVADLPVFRGHAMQLTGQIGLQFFVELPDGAQRGDYYMTFEDEHGHIDSTFPCDLVESPKAQGYYMAQVNLSSIQLAEHITPVLHLRSTDEVVVTGQSYSAQDYIDWGLKNLNPQSREFSIIYTLADYGHYSQPYLSEVNHWDINGSVYSQMTTYCTSSYDYDAVLAATSGSSIVVNSLTGTGFTKVTYSLRFGDTISLRVFLEASNISVIDDSLFAFTGTGATPVIGRDGNRVTITFNNIPATALTNAYSISYDDNTLVESVSPMSYVHGILTSTTAESEYDGRDLVCALFNFAEACS